MGGVLVTGNEDDSMMLKNPIKIKAGKPYYYQNLYGYFCILTDLQGNPIRRLVETTEVSTSGVLTTITNCLLHITVNKTVENPMFADGVLPNEYKEGGYSPTLDGLKESVKVRNQFIKESELEDNSYYYIISDTALDVGNSNSAKKLSKPIKLKSGEKYNYQNLYGYFCIITDTSGKNPKRLSETQDASISGSYTPTKNELIYITVNKSVSDYMFCDGKLPQGYIEGCYSEAVESIEKSKTIHVGAGEEFTSLLEAILYATKFMDSKVYVKSGTYNLISEFQNYYGTSFFDEYDANSVKGIILKNRVKIYFSSNARVDFKYTGSNKYVNSLFSPFNAGEYGFELHNLTLEAKNCRYPIHDERYTSYDSYNNIYDNCNIYLDNSNNANWQSKQCIGGGLGFAGNIEIKNCIFDSVNGTDDNGGVTYHNCSLSGAKSNVVITGNLFKGKNTVRCSWYGKSDKITNFIISNNLLGSAIVKRAETADATINNINVIEFNNAINS